ncbi:MAG: elongation factor 1-alpha C-terminal domain-related protein, partial [Actinomycetota bacterium]
ERLGHPDVRTVPVSALEGDNVVERSTRTPWYDGPSLLELLEDLPPADDPTGEPFRFPVQLVLRPQAAARDGVSADYRGYAGQIASGLVRVGDEVVVQPSGLRTTVAGIDTADGPLTEAFAPRSVTLRLADDLDVSRGDLVAAAAGAPEPVRQLQASVCWLSDVPLRAPGRLLLKHTTRTVPAVVTAVTGRFDLDSQSLQPAETLGLNDIGAVELRLGSPVVAEEYARHRRTGAFLLIDPHDGATLAAGMVGSPLRTVEPA